MSRSIPPRPKTLRILLAAALGLAAVIALCVAGAISYVAANAWVDHTLGVQQELDAWVASILDARDIAEDYVLSGRADTLALFEPALARERRAANHLRAIIPGHSPQGQSVARADADAMGEMADLRELVESVRRGRRDEALARLSTEAFAPRFDAFRADVLQTHAIEARLLAERRAAASRRAAYTFVGALLLALASCVSLGFAWSAQIARERTLAILARQARRRLQALSEIATRLAEVRSRAQVADIVIEHGMRAANADTSTLYMLDEAGTALELIGHRGIAAEIVEKIQRMTATSGNPGAFETVRSGTSLWVEDEEAYMATFPAFAGMKATGPRAQAFWCVPLRIEGHPVGLLSMGYYAPQKFSPEDRAFVDTFTQQCAQALLRAVTFEREDETQRWLATTLRSIGDAVIATDPEGRITFMNPVASNLTGWTEDAARAQPLDAVFRIFSEATGEIVESPVTKVLREGAVVGLANHTVLRSKSGSEVPIHDSGAPIRGETGALLGVVLVFRDVTAEKRERTRREFLTKAGEVLGASLDYQETLGTIARLAVPDLADWCAVDVLEPAARAPIHTAVAHVDPTKVEFARAVRARYPYDPSAPRGVPNVIRTGQSELHSVVDPAALRAAARDPEHLKVLEALKLESAMVVPLTARGRTFGAMTFVYAESGRHYSREDLHFAEDLARRAAMAIENASAMKEAKAARAQERLLRSEAEVASRAKDDFLATVSHELRTPLNAILGWTVTLRTRKPSSDVDRGLAIIERNARAQTKLIEDVLDVSRIISGKLALSLGPTNVAETIGAAVETVAPAADAKDIVIEARLPDPSLTITADADRMQQIVWNLLSNAVKFTPKAGRVQVTARRDGSDVCIDVTDTGEGIRADTLPLVFEPFHQADASTTRRHGGLGLGLAIVKQLVTAHGGTVAAASPGEGHGSTFSIRLPARSAVAAVARTGRTSPPPPLHADSPGGVRLDGLRLLVIDDEDDALTLVAELLRERGAEVFVAGSAGEALETFARVRPDVIVSDVGMPRVDGYSLMRQIRSLPPELGGLTPAVALTAYARLEDSQRAFAAGYQEHVTKPVEPGRLAVVVADLGGRRHSS